MAVIKTIIAREILDSRGNPTIEAKITLDNRFQAIASVPSGASLGKYEAMELRDGDSNRYRGMGVSKAVANINQVIAPKLIGQNPTNLSAIDKILIQTDGTENKSKLGANAILAASQVVCKVGAATSGLPVYKFVSQIFGLSGELKIPAPIFNLINGGKHGAGNLDFQEFHLIPSNRLTYSQALEMGEEVYQAVKQVLIRHKAIHSVGDEGGFAPNLFTNQDALQIIIEGTQEAGCEMGVDVFLGLDVAASHFFEGGKYKIRDRTVPMDTAEFAEYFIDLNSQFSLLLLEDPFHEDDWEGWKRIKNSLTKTVVVGDDLLATNPKRIAKAIAQKACSGALIKPNQIGTISETMEVVKLARQAGLRVVVSHRSGETNDDFIADFSVGIGADYVKFGAPARGERVAKYNRLLGIEMEV